MRREALSSAFSVALLIGGCPKRHAGPRIVYVPAPPPAATPAPAGPPETLVIEEVPPPEPAEVAPPEPAAPRPRRPRRPLRTEAPAAAEPAPELAEPPAEVPALEPRESVEQHAELRQQILGLHQNLRLRVAQLGRARLTAEGRKTLADARTFLAQSARALEDEDLQRSLNLARKASLLVAALERQY